MRLHGRNEDGFVIGSPQARQFERMLKGLLNPDDTRAEQAERTAARREERKVERLRRKLERPEWWYDADDTRRGINRRFWARRMAKSAAARLGVPVPEWARGRKLRRRVTRTTYEPALEQPSAEAIVAHLRWKIGAIQMEQEEQA